MLIRNVLALFLVLLLPAMPLAAAEREADHAALRQLLGEMTTALNGEDFPGFSGHLAPGFRLTFADQRTFTSVDDLAAYHRQLKAGSGITGITFAPQADGPTTFLGPDSGICTGHSADVFTSAQGSTTIASRWTATVVRDPAGAWKVASFHAGVDLLDNPILDRTRTFGTWLAAGCGLAGLVLGGLAGLLLGRRRRA